MIGIVVYILVSSHFLIIVSEIIFFIMLNYTHVNCCIYVSASLYPIGKLRTYVEPLLDYSTLCRFAVKSVYL